MAKVAAVFLLGACGGDSVDPMAPTSQDVSVADQRLNVLLITTDTLRADRLGCYGYERSTSPVIDQLSDRSFLFEHAVSQSAVTPVSHASILTGLNPYRHGLRSLHGGEGYALEGEQTTLAELLEEQGYSTAAFVSAFPASRRYGLEQGFDVWDQDFEGSEGEGLIGAEGVVNTGSAQRRGDETTDRALRWLGSRDTATPFFLWAHYFDVHDDELLPPAKYTRRFPAASAGIDDERRSLYDAELAFMDDQIGRLLSELESQGMRDRTIVALVSDHGQGLGDHGWWGHGILFQEQVRVPMLLAVPGQAGRRVSALVRTIDLVPTLAELLGLESPQLDGASLVPLFEGSDESRARVAYSESINDLSAYYASPLRNESLYALNDGRWKFVLHRENDEDQWVELYDLVADPGETRNRAAEHPGEVERLRARLQGMDPFAGALEAEPLDEESLEKLRALGYVGGSR